TGRAAAERNARERPGRLVSGDVTATERDQHLAARGNREHVSGGQAERPRFGAVDARREDLERPSLPRRAVDDSLAVRGEARVETPPARVGRRRDGRGGAGPGADEAAPGEAAADPRREGERRGQEPAPPPRLRRLGGLERARDGGLGQMIADVLQVAREVL